jgi:hypothetical protein
MTFQHSKNAPMNENINISGDKRSGGIPRKYAVL